ANVAGTVIRLTGAGSPYQTNTVCSVTNGMAQLDTLGNLYLAGSFDGTQNFGGTTLVGGWINGINFHPPQWVAGYPTCYLAKYDTNGSLIWVTSFGAAATRNQVDDLAMNSDDSVVVGYDSANGIKITRYSSGGSNLWETQISGAPF